MLVRFSIWFAVLTTILLVVECSAVKKTEAKNAQDKERSKRESIFSSPIHYDTVPFQAVQPPPAAPPVPQPTQQPQGLPLLGALVSNVPGLNGITSTLTTLVPLGNLGNLGNLGGLSGLGGLGNLGGLGGLGGLGNLGGFGNLGGLTNLGGLGGLGLPGLGNLGGILPGATPNCPLTQTLSCRCENLLPLPLQPAPTRSSDGLEILQQSTVLNSKGDKEISARLSNGLLFYQRSGFDKLANNKNSQVIQGFYTLQIKENKYLTIYYTINDLDYTVKADVTAEPPQNDLVATTASTVKF